MTSPFAYPFSMEKIILWRSRSLVGNKNQCCFSSMVSWLTETSSKKVAAESLLLSFLYPLCKSKLFSSIHFVVFKLMLPLVLRFENWVCFVCFFHSIINSLWVSWLRLHVYLINEAYCKAPSLKVCLWVFSWMKDLFAEI